MLKRVAVQRTEPQSLLTGRRADNVDRSRVHGNFARRHQRFAIYGRQLRRQATDHMTAAVRQHVSCDTGAREGLVLRSCTHPPLVSVAVKTDETKARRGQPWEQRARLGGLRRLGVSGRHSSAVSTFTSAICTSRLARDNASGPTHSQPSSNCLCTNGG